MRKKHKLAAVFLVLTGQVAGVAGLAHAEVDALVKDARALLEKGQAKAAFDLLEPAETPRAGDPDFDTVLGIAANETAQYTRAVFALERVLSVQPENSRARAELGRALFAVGDTQGSRRLLMETKGEKIPPEAALTIDQFLQAIDRAEEAGRSSVRTYVEGSLGNDTNINSGPAGASIAVPAFGGLIFALNNSGIKTRDGFAAVGAGVSGRYVMAPRWSLIGNLSANVRGNFQYNAFNTRQVDANAGASYRFDKNEFTGVVQVGSYDVNAMRARDQAGLVGEWTYRPDGYRQWNSYLQWGRLAYPGQSIRDVDRTVVGTSYAHSFRTGLLVFGGGYLGLEDTKASGVPHLAHRLVGLRAGAQQALSPDVALFGSAGYEQRNYRGPDPLFLVTRRDRQTSLNLGLNWVPGKFWRVTPQLTYLSVKSNVPVSDYNRALFSVTLRRDF